MMTFILTVWWMLETICAVQIPKCAGLSQLRSQLVDLVVSIGAELMMQLKDDPFSRLHWVAFCVGCCEMITISFGIRILSPIPWNPIECENFKKPE
jgi:hypothetical protein